MTDAVLAIIHHLLAFALAALLFGEAVAVRNGMSSGTALRVARIDVVFGAAAGTLLIVGFLRVFLGAKPEAFYLESPYFWAKIGAFAAVAVLSIVPTRRFVRWARAARGDAGFLPPDAEVRRVRAFLTLELAVFVLIPTLAAIMARGYGL